MACGTPVIAYDGGSVPEVIEDGVTGFIVRDLDDAVKAVSRVRHLNRARCREVFETRFGASSMAKDYIGVYELDSQQRWERSKSCSKITARSDKRIDDSNRTSVAQADATLIV
jgi:Glycosyl transferases group 1